MNHKSTKIITLLLLFLVLFSNTYAEKKLAQTGFQFLSVTPDARSAALAGAVTTMPALSAALWSNPAVLGDMNVIFNVMANQNNWIADINNYSVTGAFRPANGRYGNFAFSFLFVDYGDIEGTIIAGNDQGFIETPLIKPYAYSIGLGYATRLSDRFSVGGQVKLVDQYLGPAIVSLESAPDYQNAIENEESVFAFDFGTTYKTGFKSLIFGMSVRNFSKEVRFAREGFQLPLTFNIGVSMDMLDFMSRFSEVHQVFLSLDAEHPRSYPEFLRVGMEYGFEQTFFLRLGYVSNRDEENISYGFGFSKFGLGFDYAYTPFGVFDNVQRFSLNFTF